MARARTSSPGVQLIVAEKPSVARDIAAVVGARKKAGGWLEGPGVRVSWCVGHLAELCEPHEYDARWKSWSPALLPLLPESFKLRPSKSGAAQLRVLRGLMNDAAVDSIVNACDAGREGELIFRRVYELARCKKPVHRLWISSLTTDAIRRGLAGLRPGGRFDALGDAAAARAEADWLVGMNATRALTGLARKGGGGRDSLMSVGRVQTPTLAMIARREAEIESFQKQPYWQVEARFSWPEARPGEPHEYAGTWRRGKEDRLGDAASAQAIADAVKGQPGEVSAATHREVREKPPLLFDLTSLQKAANQRYGMSAKRTLAAAQALYETHKALTYPRTDSRHLTSDMAAQLPEILEALAPPYREFADQALARGVPRSRRMIDDSQVGDHHAIIPTGKNPPTERLGQDEARVYDLVVRRFLAGFLADAVFDKTHIETRVPGTPMDHVFVSDGRVLREPGWLEVEPRGRDRAQRGRGKQAKDADADAEGSEPELRLPRIDAGARVHTEDARVIERETQPPKRYTDATLLAAMEHAGREVEEEALRRAMKDRGLGTPATRAAIIETLLGRQYISRQGRSLVPTARGRALIAAMPVPDLLSPELTGAWEEKLARIERGELSRAQFMSEIRAFTTRAVETMAGAEPPAPPDAGAVAEAEVLGACPVCGQPVREGRKAYTCATGKACSFVIFKRVAGRGISTGLVQVLLAGKQSQVLRGFRSKAGKRFSAALALSAEGKVELVFAGATSGRQGEPDARPERKPARERSSGRSRAARAAKSSAGNGAGTETETRTGATRAPRCPACKQGHIIAGRRGWGCSRWRESCGFVVWFEQGQTRLPDDEAERLFRRGQTRLLDGISPAGKARLVLDLEAEDNVRVELSKRGRKQA